MHVYSCAIFRVENQAPKQDHTTGARNHSSTLTTHLSLDATDIKVSSARACVQWCGQPVGRDGACGGWGGLGTYWCDVPRAVLVRARPDTRVGHLALVDVTPRKVCGRLISRVPWSLRETNGARHSPMCGECRRQSSDRARWPVGEHGYPQVARDRDVTH